MSAAIEGALGLAPLRITARLMGPIVVSDPPVHLDALLTMAVAKREGRPPVCAPIDVLRAMRESPIDLPLARSACGRFYLATRMLGETESHQLRYVQRRFPVSQVIARGSAKRLARSAGEHKDFRSAIQVAHVTEPTWYAVGDADAVRGMLGWITGLGRRRAVGHGAVISWTVEPCESWGAGFPVLDVEGRPLRNVPLDVPGLAENVEVRIGRVAPPYWLQVDEEEIAVA